MNTNKADLSFIILPIPILSIFLMLFWLTGMHLLQDPAEKLYWIVACTVMGTALACAYESWAVGMKRDRDKGSYNSIAWLFLIVLMWFSYYPIYMYKRKHYNLKNMLIPALIVMVAFVFSLVNIASSIDNQMALEMQILEYQLK